MTAQQMVEDYKTNTRREAELLVREAETRADALSGKPTRRSSRSMKILRT
jgi:hypothetical protein